MQIGIKPDIELERLQNLYSYEILDTEPSEAFDDLTRLAAFVCGTAIAFISLVDKDRQWFKSKVGIQTIETARDVALCPYAILQSGILVIPDATKDERYANNPLVTGEPYIRFYASAPLITAEGFAVGTLCVIDSHPKQITPEQCEALRLLSRQVVKQLELHRNITNLRAVEEKLRHSKERFELAVRGSNDGIWDWDLETNEVFFSKRWKEILGYEEDEISNNFESWSSRLHPDDYQRVLNEVDAYLRGEIKSYNLEYRMQHRDGTYRWILSRGVALRDETNKPYRMSGSQSDITERKKNEEALQQSEAQLRQQTQQLKETLQKLQQTQAKLVQSEKMSSLGQLVAGIAHEINNPINFIHGNIVHAQQYIQDLLEFLQLYQTHVSITAPELQAKAEEIELEFILEDLPKLLSSMKVGSERIRDIVVSLRAFSRLDEAEVKFVDIHQGIDSTLMILHHRLKANSKIPAIQVVKNYGNLPEIECYAGQLNQVFMNILANAIDAVEERYSKPDRASINGKITITTQVINSKLVQIIIADNGIGMSEEVKQQLFNPFFTTKPIGQGTGLGLSITYQIITEKHQGTIQCLSTVGEGTEFIIEIPIKQDQRRD